MNMDFLKEAFEEGLEVNMLGIIFFVIFAFPPLFLLMKVFYSGGVLIDVLFYISSFVLSVVAALMFALVVGMLILLYRAWPAAFARRREGALLRHKEQLRLRLASLDDTGSYRRARIDPSYLEDTDRLQSLAEQEDDPEIRGLMQEYCQLSKKLQMS